MSQHKRRGSARRLANRKSAELVEWETKHEPEIEEHEEQEEAQEEVM